MQTGIPYRDRSPDRQMDRTSDRGLGAEDTEVWSGQRHAWVWSWEEWGKSRLKGQFEKYKKKKKMSMLGQSLIQFDICGRSWLKSMLGPECDWRCKEPEQLSVGTRSFLKVTWAGLTFEAGWKRAREASVSLPQGTQTIVGHAVLSKHDDTLREQKFGIVSVSHWDA